MIELMKKYGIKGTFNINGGLFGEAGSIKRIGNLGFKDCGPDMKDGKIFKYAPHYRIPEDEIKQVYEDMKKSIDMDIEALEKIMGYPILGHAYAFGSTSKEVEAYLKEKGILYGRGVMRGKGFSFPKNPWNLPPTCSHMDKDVFDLLDKFIHAKAETEDLLFYMWGHGYECDYGSKEASWEKTERIFATIAGRDDIVYCTNAEVFQRI